MKKHATIIVVIVAVALAIIASGTLDTLLVFLLVGAIPGTTYSIPPVLMLLIVGAAIIVFTKWIATRQLYPGSPKVKASQDKVLRRTARRSARATSKKRQAAKAAQTLQTAEAS